jgi:hypothetical protein
MLNPSLHLDHLKQNTQEINSLTHPTTQKIEIVRSNHHSMQKLKKQKEVLHVKRVQVLENLLYYYRFNEYNQITADILGLWYHILFQDNFNLWWSEVFSSPNP